MNNNNAPATLTAAIAARALRGESVTIDMVVEAYGDMNTNDATVLTEYITIAKAVRNGTYVVAPIAPAVTVPEFAPEVRDHRAGLNVGDKVDEMVKVTMVRYYTSHFGYRPQTNQVVKMLTKTGHVFTTFYSGARQFKEGEVITVKATVKALEVHPKWGAQTMVTRVKVLEA